MGSSSKYTVRGGLRWAEEFPDRRLVHVEDGIEGAKAQEFRDDSGAESRRKNLRSCGSYLWGEDAHPDFFCLGLACPETEKVLEVARTLCDLAGDGAVDGDGGVCDVPEDAIVGGRGATEIVLGLEAVDGDHYVEALDVRPMGRNGAEGAGDDLNVDATAFKRWEDDFEFAMANQWISADEGDVEWLQFVDRLKDISDEFVVFVVGQLTEGGVSFSAKVSWIIGVTPRTAERALAGNFDRQRWLPARENGLPRMHDF